MTSDQAVWHAGHAHRVGPPSLHHTNFRRSFKRGAPKGHIHALVQRDALLSRHGLNPADQSGIPSITDREKTRAKGIVIGSRQRVESEKIDVISNQHQFADFNRGA